MKKLSIISLISLFTVSMFIVFPSNVSAKTLADLRRELNEIEKREQDNNNSINMTSAEIQRVQNEIGSIYKEVDTITKDIATATDLHLFKKLKEILFMLNIYLVLKVLKILYIDMQLLVS